MHRSRHKFRPSTAVLGRAISDCDEQLIGTAEELLIDVDEGRIAYLRISLSNEIHPDRWYVTVPWSVVHLPDRCNRPLQLGVRKRALARLARQDVDLNSSDDL